MTVQFNELELNEVIVTFETRLQKMQETECHHYQDTGVGGREYSESHKYWSERAEFLADILDKLYKAKQP